MDIKLKIGQKILDLRRKRGVTQGRLAEHLGVTKASVSKWETEQSCPDISLLPRIAAYFGMSIDELVGYEAQLSPKETTELHDKLTRCFAEEGFEGGMKASREVANDYYSCYPMLLKVSVVYLNHLDMAPTREAAEEMQELVLELCGRVEKYSGDDFDRQQAKNLSALIYLFRGDPDSVLKMFGETVRPFREHDSLVAQALFLRGEQERAREITQIMAYQSVCRLMNEMAALITYCDDCDYVSEVVKKAEALWKLFEPLTMMDNAMAIVYLMAAPKMLKSGLFEEGLEYIEKCAAMAPRFENFQIGGNDFFNLVEPWLAENIVVPREQRLVMESFREQITNNPDFTFAFGKDGRAPGEYKERFAKMKEGLLSAENNSFYKEIR